MTLRLCNTQWPNSGHFLQNALVEYIGVYSGTNKTSAAQFSSRHLHLECNHAHHVTGQNGWHFLQWRHTRENGDPRVQLKIINMQIIGRSRGGAPGARPPYGSRFFRFDMQNFRNVATSGVHGPPPYEVHAPLREILDPPLQINDTISRKALCFIIKITEYNSYQGNGTLYWHFLRLPQRQTFYS